VQGRKNNVLVTLLGVRRMLIIATGVLLREWTAPRKRSIQGIDVFREETGVQNVKEVERILQEEDPL
jgi:hypothetical protein